MIMSIRESILALSELKQRDVDLSALTGVEGQKGTMVELTLGDREILEDIIIAHEKNTDGKKSGYWRAAYVTLCLYEDNGNGELVRVFDNEDVHKLAVMPWQKLHDLYVEAAKVCGLIPENESIAPDESDGKN